MNVFYSAVFYSAAKRPDNSHIRNREKEVSHIQERVCKRV
jgi:hypothetical protein